MKHLSEEQIKVNGDFVPWCAGFFDGEGSVSIVRGRTNKNGTREAWVRVTITQIQRECLLDIQGMFGGRLLKVKRVRSNQRQVSRWVIDGEIAIKFLRTLYPHLRVKRAQADLAFEFFQTTKPATGNHYISPLDYTKREAIRNAMISTNGRSIQTGVSA